MVLLVVPSLFAKRADAVLEGDIDGVAQAGNVIGL
jgi:hypothetical protein